MEKMVTDVKSTKQPKTIRIEENIIVTHYGEPNFTVWAKQMIDVYEKIEFEKQG